MLPQGPLSAFSTLLLPAEIAAIRSAAAETLSIATPGIIAGNDVFSFPKSVQAIAAADQFQKLPDGVKSSILSISFSAMAMILRGESAGVMRKGAYALTRLVSAKIEPRGTRGALALMSAGAAILHGKTQVPILKGDIGEPIIDGAVAAMRVPAEFIHLLYEERAKRGADPASQLLDWFCWTFQGAMKINDVPPTFRPITPEETERLMRHVSTRFPGHRIAPMPDLPHDSPPNVVMDASEDHFYFIKAAQAVSDLGPNPMVRVHHLPVPIAPPLFGVILETAGFSLRTVDIGDSAIISVEASQAETSQFPDIDGERLKAMLFGLKFLFGQFPWSHEGSAT